VSGGSGRVLADAPRARWSDLRPRVISACVLAPLGLACLWLGGVAWGALLATATAGLLLEWWALARQFAAGRRAVGVAAIALSALALFWLRTAPLTGRLEVLFVLLVVWASDIGAYLAGRCLGGPKLAPRVSPGKTWSGAAGGLLAAALAGLAMGAGGWGGVLAGMLLGLAAQAGDLLESAAKRAAGVKDSGRLIPGHGGLLDRLDGMLAAAPVAAGLAMLTGHGIVFWR
jgi:phosphatidate cytidylyltransferase